MIKVVVCGALGRMGGTTARALLHSVLATESSEEVQREIALTLNDP